MHQHVLITAQTASATDSVPDAGHTKQLRRCWYWVVQAYDDNQTQMTLDSFLSFSQRFAKIKSRRLQKAVAGITGTASPNPPSILCHSPLPPLTALLSTPPPPIPTQFDPLVPLPLTLPLILPQLQHWPLDQDHMPAAFLPTPAALHAHHSLWPVTMGLQHMRSKVLACVSKAQLSCLSPAAITA